jgi:ADP-L-glycero-D-manno-heptose 6-epimerase
MGARRLAIKMGPRAPAAVGRKVDAPACAFYKGPAANRAQRNGAGSPPKRSERMIVVTGGAGFIGSNLVASLEAAGAGDIAVVDWLGTGEKWRNLAKRPLAAMIEPGDLMPFLARNARAIQTVFHMGAISDTTATDADLIVRTNFALPLALWDWCASSDTRFIYASSAATYGDGSEGFDDLPDIASLKRLKPMNAYGWSKHEFDLRVARLIETGAPRPPQWVGLKFFNVYGPNEYHKGGQRSVAVQIHEHATAHAPATLFKSHNPNYADGGQLRDFVWVDDVCDVMVWLNGHPEVNGLYNLGSGKARSFADLAKAVFRAMNREPQIRYIETPEAIRAKYQYFTEAKMERLRAAGYAKPMTELEDGIARYVRDFLQAADPYR